MTLLADLLRGRAADRRRAGRRAAAIPDAARATFAPRSLTLRVGDEPGWDALQQRLYRLGYARVDVVSAAGEYAVRGGILDVFPATAERPVRLEFFGDELESLRPFDIATQRSDRVRSKRSRSRPGSRSCATTALRASVLARAAGEANVISAVRAYLAAGQRRSRTVDRARATTSARRCSTTSTRAPSSCSRSRGCWRRSTASLDERALARRATCCWPGSTSGELDVREDEVGEALVAELDCPYPRLAAATRCAGAAPRADRHRRDRNRRPAMAAARASKAMRSRRTRPSISAARWNASRSGARLGRGRRDGVAGRERCVAPDRDACAPPRSRSSAARRSCTCAPPEPTASRSAHARRHRLRRHRLDREPASRSPGLRLHVLGDREIFGQPAKRVKLRAVKEGVPVTLADLKVGDYVVHAVHGIGQYLGLRTETILGATQRLPRPAGTPAPIACSSRCTRCIR